MRLKMVKNVQKQESFDFHGNTTTEAAVITEYGVKFRADPAGAHKTGFFADQRENREWLSRQVDGKTVVDGEAVVMVPRRPKAKE